VFVCVCVFLHDTCVYSLTGYNDIGLCDTSSVVSDILWYRLIPHC